MIPLENVEVRATETRGKKFTFGLYAKNHGNGNETLKAAKYHGSGLVPAHHESCIPLTLPPYHPLSLLLSRLSRPLTPSRSCVSISLLTLSITVDNMNIFLQQKPKNLWNLGLLQYLEVFSNLPFRIS
jgi:hypothetical protein